MRYLLFSLFLLTGCNDSTLTKLPEEPLSVKWNHSFQSTGEEPVCYNASITRIDDKHILCEWNCLMFWTNINGAGKYYVSREWIKVEEVDPPQWVSGQFFPYPENADEQSWPCF